MNKITCICLGVHNMERAITFYRDKLGFYTDCKESNPKKCYFDTPGTKLELYPLDLLANNINPNNPPTFGKGFGGILLTYNVDCVQKVDNAVKRVRNAGGAIVKEPQDTADGGYHAYFTDLDGYYWEVIWDPHFSYDEKGLLVFEHHSQVD